MERNAAKKEHKKKKPPMGVGMERLAIAPEPERVSYSKEYLAELRSAQLLPPPPPPDAQEEGEGGGDDGVDEDGGDGGDGDDGDDGDTAMAVMVDAGGGGTQIMDEGIVRVMKARRAERAAAAKAGVDDFISLNVSADDDGSELVLRPANKTKKKKESRLARPDGDDAEEIANYVDDAERVLLLPSTSKAARRQHERRRKQAIADTIAEAEAEAGGGDGDGGSDVSRDSLVEGFERDQIRKGAFAAAAGELAGGRRRGVEAELDALARNPPAAQALPLIGSVVARLEARLHEVEMHKKLAERQVEMLLREKREIREREDAVQARLKEAGDKYEQLRQDAGDKYEQDADHAGHAASASAALPPAGDRGLESFGNTPIRVED